MHPALSARPLPWVDPAALFAGGPAGAAHSFWLDAGPDAADGWSYLGVGVPEDAVDAVRDVPISPGPGVAADRAWGPFPGGWIGWLDYDGAAARAGAPAPSATAHADAGQRWLRVDRFVAIDHAQRRQWAVAPESDLERFADAVAGWARQPAPATPPVPRRATTARHAAPEYAVLIEQCRDAIRDGDAYQLCLTTRFEVAASGADAIDAFATFLRLRAATPAHHGGFLRVGDHALLSASPERFLDVRAGTIRTHPIKGTRPRGVDDEHDRALAAELQASPKERAENVMIVDLMRNDLARVCDPATVTVERLLEVESYAAVHQLVSTVSGRARAGTTIGDLLDAAFPAGSMTGAPKLSAMTILQGLERGPRGVFAGCFGWVGVDGAADLAMVIRSIVTHPHGAYVGAGGGITWGSDAAAEVAEVGIKARGPLHALGAQLPPGW